MRYLCSGAAGFIGSHLCERLIREGHQVEGWDDLSSGVENNVIHLRESGRFHLAKFDVIEKRLPAGRFDGIFHLASPASPIDYQKRPIATLRVGAVGTENLLLLAEAWGCPFLYASSSEVYGEPLEHPQGEGYRGNVSTTGPRAMYDEAKRYGEAITSVYGDGGVDVRIARIFNTYGPRMRAGDGRVIPTFLHQALTGEAVTLCGDGMQTRSFCYIDDLVEGLLVLFNSGVKVPVNLGNPEEVRVGDLVEMIREDLGLTSLPVRHVGRRLDEPTRRCPDITRARGLGWEPRISLRTGLKLTIMHSRGALCSST